ncbi:MAG: enterochelin esterase, partial [Gaiellaceae bacterium]
LGRALPEFERWLERDPVRLAGHFDEAVQSWRGVWLDAGRRDEYFLDLGAMALRDALLAAGLPEERLQFELVEGGHSGMSHRYPLSLAWLVEQLS